MFFFISAEKHLIKNGMEESLPLFDEGLEAVKDVAPIASPDYSIIEDASASGAACANNVVTKAASIGKAIHSLSK